MKGFYVTVIRESGNARKVGWLYGPLADAAEAERRVNLCRRIACDIDPRCSWDAFGTASIDREGADNLAGLPEGHLNSHVDHYEQYGVVNW